MSSAVPVVSASTSKKVVISAATSAKMAIKQKVATTAKMAIKQKVRMAGEGEPAARFDDAQSDDEDAMPIAERRARASAKAAAAAETAREGGGPEDEDELPLAERRARAAAVAASAAAAPAQEGSDSEEELSLAERRARATAVAASAAAAPAHADSDSEEELSLAERRARAAAAAAAAGASHPASKKRKQPDVDEGERDEKDDETEDDDDDDDDDADDGGLAVAMAQAVLERGTVGDHEGVLSALGVPITRDSPFDVMRRAYRGLAKLIHPDRLARRFAGATKAFQALARAFDTLTSPEEEAAAGGKSAKPAGPGLMRSNEGCYRTKVRCPRCASQWGTPDSGLQPYEYNFMMMGLRTYVCCACLFEFGCVTAHHSCPVCSRPISYHPDSYHEKVRCHHKRCRAEFGFRVYHAGPRILANLREIVLEQQKRAHKLRGAAAGRGQRRLAPPLSEAAQRRQAEKLFVLGLVDACPRCGVEPGDDDEAGRLAHLRCCNDAGAHAVHARAQARKAAKEASREQWKDAQGEATNLAAWQFLGGRASQAWMLTDAQLQKQCGEKGIAVEGRHRQLEALAEKLATDEGVEVDDESMPTNLHACGLDELKQLCAAHRITAPRGSSSSELIALLESRDGRLAALVAHEADGEGARAALTVDEAYVPSPQK